MRHPRVPLLAALGFCAALASAQGPPAKVDPAAVLAAQRKAVADNWKAVGAGEPALHETEHLLVAGPKADGDKVKETAATLDKHYATARGALQFGDKAAHPGKVAVYLFADKDHFAAFVRRVEKRRFSPGETACFRAFDDELYAVAGPPARAADAATEVRAAEQVCTVLLQRKMGVTTELPPWLAGGFGRATLYRVSPKDKITQDDRKAAATFAQRNKRSPKDIWGGALEGEEAAALNGSLADFFAYGPGAAKFGAFVEGHKAGDNLPRKTTEQALEAIGIKAENVDKGWKAYVVNPPR